MIHALLFWSLREQIRNGYPDFTIFYGAGKIVSQGMGHHLYDRALQYRVQEQFTHNVETRKAALPYNHPPFEALLFVPLSHLSYVGAYFSWNVLNLSALLLIIFVLRPHIAIVRSLPIAFWFLVALASFPVFVALLQGQDILLFLLFLALTFASLKKGDDISAGLWLGAGLFRFHLIVPVLLLFLVRKKWKGLLGFSIAATVLALVSLFAVGWDSLRNYPGFVMNMERSLAQGSTIVTDMPSLRGLAGIFSHGGSESSFIMVLLSALVLGLAASRWRTSSGDLAFALAVVVTPLISYHTLAHDLSLLLIPLFLTLDFLREKEASNGLRAALWVPAVFFTLMSPLQMILWFQAGKYCLVAVVLLLWAYGLWRVSAIAGQKNLPASEVVAR